MVVRDGMRKERCRKTARGRQIAKATHDDQVLSHYECERDTGFIPTRHAIPISNVIAGPAMRRPIARSRRNRRPLPLRPKSLRRIKPLTDLRPR